MFIICPKLSQIRIDTAIKEVPKIIASNLDAIRRVREGAMRTPAVIVAKRAIKNVKMGAKYHCGDIDSDLLAKAKPVPMRV
jgi:hypothetical protein